MGFYRRGVTEAGRLQWGHGREAMDGVQQRQFLSRRNRLQWGHGREAMDGALMGASAAGGAALQWGHGREAMDGPATRARTTPAANFNGAMAVRPWMVRWDR